LSTCTPACEVLVLPLVSRATADTVCAPCVARRVFHEAEYGAVVSSEPTFAPSTLNCTPATPRSSDAVARRVTVPPTTAPSAGAVSAKVGGEVSHAAVDVLNVARADVLPETS
jgi:hypothetical protein